MMTTNINQDQAIGSYDEWVGYASQSAAMHSGMSTVLSFLLQNKSSFSADGHVPRDWAHVAQALGSSPLRGDTGVALENDFLAVLPALLPGQTGENLGLFVKAMRVPDEIVEQLLSSGSVDNAKFNKAFGGGFSASSQFFAYQFAMCLASRAAHDILVADKSNAPIEPVCCALAQGALLINDDSVAVCIDQFKRLVKGAGGETLLQKTIGAVTTAFGAQLDARQQSTLSHPSPRRKIL